MKRKLDSTEYKTPDLIGKKVVLTTTTTKNDLSGELGKAYPLDGGIDVTEGFGITVDDLKKLQNDAKIFIKNSDLLHSKELYNFEKIDRKRTKLYQKKRKGLSEDEVNTISSIFSMLKKEKNNLIKYSEYLPLWVSILLRKFLHRNYQKVVSLSGFGRLEDRLKENIRKTSPSEQNNAMRYYNCVAKIKRETPEAHTKKFGRVNRKKIR